MSLHFENNRLCSRKIEENIEVAKSTSLFSAVSCSSIRGLFNTRLTVKHARHYINWFQGNKGT